jgi:DNA invertase Pin-like site-specific DNA recombinase
LISERTEAGLAAAKARGKRLGGLNDAGITRRQEAIARAAALRPLLTEMEAAEMSARAIATELPHPDTRRRQVARHAGPSSEGAP